MGMTIKGILVVALGIGLGLAGAYYFVEFEFANSREGFFDGQWAPRSASGPSASVPKLAVVGPAKHDLGEMLVGQQYECEFMLRNVGADVLEFSLAGSLPASIRTDLDDVHSVPIRLPAQATYSITVFVKPTEVDTDFSKAIVLQVTGAESRTILSVSGKVAPGLLAVPSAITIQKNIVETDPPSVIDIYCWAADRIQVNGVEIEGHPNVDWIQHSTTNLSAEDLARQPGAKSGLKLELRRTSTWPKDMKSASLVVRTDRAEFQPLRIPITVLD